MPCKEQREEERYPTRTKELVDLVESIRREVNSSSIKDEEVAINENIVGQSLKDGVAKGLAGIVLLDGVGGEGELRAVQVGEEGNVKARVEPMTSHDVRALAHRA